MAQLPPRPDLDQLRLQAKERLRSVRAGDPETIAWIDQAGAGRTLSAAQLQLARDHGFASWPRLQLEVARRTVLDLRQPEALSQFLSTRPEAATSDLANWMDHPRGASPLGYVAMARFDTVTGHWRDVEGTAAMAHALIAAGAPVDGNPGDPETPLITAASYGDGGVAAVLIAAGADVEARAAEDAGGVPGGTALLHAAVFGMTDVLDLLAAAGATLGSLEEAAAAGDLSGWGVAAVDEQTRVRALIMAAHHARLDVIDTLVAAGTPFDVEDRIFARHPLRLAAGQGRPASVERLLSLGAERSGRDRSGLTALDHCRHGRATAADPAPFDAVANLLTR